MIYLKLFVSTIIRFCSWLISLGKKELEKEYVVFKLFKSIKLIAPSLIDTTSSIYLHSVYEFEKKKNDPELTKLFYLNNAKEAFYEFYNNQDDFSFKIKLEEILHTNSKARSLKNRTINIENEIADFIKIFDLQTRKAASQSNKNLLRTAGVIDQMAIAVDRIDKKVHENPETLDVIYDAKTFISDVDNPTDTIPRKIIHFDDLKNRINNPFLQAERINLKDAILKHKRIVLLANGGVGKSTELKKVAWSFNDNELIPIFISLGTYTNQKLNELLPPRWQNVNPEKLLLIFDGLDEVKSADFLIAIKNILFFVEQNKEVNFLISCRTNFFDLPITDNKDSLNNMFAPFFLNEINVYSVETREFIDKKYRVNADNFIHQVTEKGYIDLTENPFYLTQMLEIYSANGSLESNMSKLFEQFVTSNIKFDENKYRLSVEEIKHKKGTILKLLERIALAMEILGKNTITSDELFSIIDQTTEFNLLIHTLSYRKKVGEDEIWQFDHRLIQEYLAAKSLAKQSVEMIIQFIAFEPTFKKLIPSWLNTLTFLINILDQDDPKLNSLVNWVIENEKEVLVKMEREKISEEIRIMIFQGIFNFYKTYDVWISSNKFSYKELASFGQSDANIAFLMKEIADNKNKPTTLISALSIIGHFEYGNIDLKLQIKTMLFKLIEENLKSPSILSASIIALTSSKAFDDNLISSMITLLNNKKNPQVRSAMYSLLVKSNSTTRYLGYILEGYSVIINKEAENRSYGDSYQLRECIKAEKSAIGIKKILVFLQENNRFEFTYDSEDVLRSVLNNAKDAYPYDNTLYEIVFQYTIKEIKRYHTDKLDKFIDFFNETNTRKKAFYDAWSMEDDPTGDKLLTLAKFIEPDVFDFIIKEYIDKRISEENLKRLIFDMNWVKNLNRNSLENQLKKETGFQIDYAPQIDYEGIRSKRLNDSFSLLFDHTRFEQETLRIFNDEKKDEFTNDELWEVKKKNNKYEEWEDKYLEISLSLLREFRPHVSKKTIELWFKKDAQVERYRVSTVYEYLINKRIQIITKEQEQWITNWCNKTLEKFDFKTAITKDGNGFHFKWDAIWISFFMKKFKLTFSSEIMLDMLSFDYIEGSQWAGIGYIIEKVEAKEITARIVENLKNEIQDSHVIRNYIKYISDGKIMEAYPSILKLIINIDKDEHDRGDFLDIYFKGTNDVQGLKKILPEIDSKLRWDIVKYLYDSGENDYLVPFLTKILISNTDESIKASEYLVKLQNLDGVKYFVNWIIQNEDPEKFYSNRFDCLLSLKKTEWIPYLLELLEYSFQKKISLRGLDTLNSLVLSSFHTMAMSSQQDLNQVIETLKKFLKENIEKYDNVNYLIHTIERIETQFYLNKAEKYSINDALKKLDLIEK